MCEIGSSPNLAAQGQSVHQWHYPVGDNEVGHVVFEAFERLDAIARASHPVSFVDKDQGPDGEKLRLIIHEQDRVHLWPPIGQFSFFAAAKLRKKRSQRALAATALVCLLASIFMRDACKHRCLLWDARHVVESRAIKRPIHALAKGPGSRQHFLDDRKQHVE